jgi:hypothetical protein
MRARRGEPRRPAEASGMMGPCGTRLFQLSGELNGDRCKVAIGDTALGESGPLAEAVPRQESKLGVVQEMMEKVGHVVAEIAVNTDPSLHNCLMGADADHDAEHSQGAAQFCCGGARPE